MSRYRYSQLPGQPPSLLGRIIAVVFGLAVLAATFVVGAFVLTVFVGLLIIGGIAVYARVWWLKRKFAAGETSFTDAGPQNTAEGQVLDAEYTVVEERRRPDE